MQRIRFRLVKMHMRVHSDDLSLLYADPLHSFKQGAALYDD